MKIIFLDIDGVLNYRGCKARSPSGCLGIDSDKLCILQSIVAATGAKIVLTSTWKIDWEKTDYVCDLPKDGQYLQGMFIAHKMYIYDKTVESSWGSRGQGIIDFINNCKQLVESFVIIDDETFDYSELQLDKFVVKTNFHKGGLSESDAKKAIQILS